MIDFERCHYTESPKNITQFMQYLSGDRIRKILEKKGFFLQKDKVIEIARKYKEGAVKIDEIIQLFIVD
jgi:predicted Ser/Thr protein kinase